MTGRDLKALVEDMESRGLLDKDICVFDYDDHSGCNWLTLYKSDKDHTMVEYCWNGTQFEYSEFDGITGEPI